MEAQVRYRGQCVHSERTFGRARAVSRPGGLDFIIGDGALRYGTERVWESYYSARVLEGFFTTIDVQRIVNPAYNQDRGPLSVDTFAFTWN